MSISKIVGLSICGVLALILFFGSFKVVDAGTSGVKVTLGSVSEEVLQEGIHFKLPIVQKIVNMTNQIQRIDKQINAASKDLQEVNALIVVNYSLNRFASAKIYQNVGKGYAEILIAPAIQENIKAITARYTAEELITKRQEVSLLMSSLLGEKMKPYGININSFNIANFNFSKEFNKAIESKQTAQQLALKAKQDLDRIKVEAEQKIAQAKAEAESLRLQKQEITPELLRLREIEMMQSKWNGQLPQYVTGNNGSILSIPTK